MTDASTHERQYDLSDAQRDLRDGIRDLVAEHVAPRAAAIDAAGEFPADVREALAAHDIFALPFEEEHGGTGTGALMLVVAIESTWPRPPMTPRSPPGTPSDSPSP